MLDRSITHSPAHQLRRKLEAAERRYEELRAIRETDAEFALVKAREAAASTESALRRLVERWEGEAAHWKAAAEAAKGDGAARQNEELLRQGGSVAHRKWPARCAHLAPALTRPPPAVQALIAERDALQDMLDAAKRSAAAATAAAAAEAGVSLGGSAALNASGGAGMALAQEQAAKAARLQRTLWAYRVLTGVDLALDGDGEGAQEGVCVVRMTAELPGEPGRGAS